MTVDNIKNRYAEILHVSRMTVRKAVEELIQEGRIVRIPGKGLAIPEASGSDDSLRHKLAFIIRYSPDDDFFSRTVLACSQVANEYGYGYSIYNIASGQPADINVLDDVDGVLLTYYNEEHGDKLLAAARKAHIPMVCIDNIPLDNDVAYVLSDDVQGGYMAAKYLLEHGHRDILFIIDQQDEYSINQRLTGYKMAMEEYGLSVKEHDIMRINTKSDLELVLAQRLNDSRPFSAIMSYTDTYVAEAYRVLRDMGIDIPEKVSLVGYGDFMEGRLLEVPLTTIVIPTFDMGAAACRMLIDYLEGRGPLGRMVLSVKLIERASVAPCSKSK